jgi:hypothetical protein
MNYRHAFHAGNFADVHKHSILARVLLHLRLKPGAFRVIDTHAGSGRYDLCGSEATRSGEWHQGIERIWRAREAGAVHDLIKPYLDVVAALNPGGELRTYPGSPLIAQSLLRAQDRLIACELEPGSARALAATLRGDRRAKALRIDGWTAAAAYVPPPERRGLVLIDPPFEEAVDFTHLSNILTVAHRKWPNRHLPPLVPNQGPGGSRRTGAAASKAVGAQYPAFRADNGAPTRRGRVDRVGPGRGEPAFHARAGSAQSDARPLPAAVAGCGRPGRLAGGGARPGAVGGALERRSFQIESIGVLNFLVGHNLFGEPGSTFPDQGIAAHFSTRKKCV